MTAERFIPNPFRSISSGRLYRTGDLGRYLPDGNIEFLGRLDHQVKIRGFRIELGEIEAMLGEHEAVRQCVVMAREDTPGDKRLVAYMVPEGNQTPSIGAMRQYLKEKLPEYMVPSAFVILESLPLTPNGKIDRKALPAPAGGRPPEMDYVAPRSDIEKTLAGLWAEILALEAVSIHDNFFELGGHSLLATQLISRIRRTFGVEASLHRLFETPTVAAFADYIETIRWTSEELGSAEALGSSREEGKV
jgi:acyl carrier protein